MKLTNLARLFAILAAFLLLGPSAAQPGSLFPTDLPLDQWTQFGADGFSVPVTGVIYTNADPPYCGVPVGGIGTGCLDIEGGGVLGFNSIFVAYPRRPQLLAPFLGLSVAGTTYVLADRKYLAGGKLQGSHDFRFETNPADWVTLRPKIEGVQPAKEIRYWGHYPVADLQYDTDAPVNVALRAWSPFLPGDSAASNTPAAVFEVHLRNTSASPQKGTIAFSFPGPTNKATWPVPTDRQGLNANVAPGGPEVTATEFPRRQFSGKSLRGVSVSAGTGIEYCLAVTGNVNTRFGGGLSEIPNAWAGIADHLPDAQSSDAGASAAVDFDLKPGQTRVVRFLLTWFTKTWKNPGQGEREFTNYYTTRYTSAADVAKKMAKDQGKLLARTLAWQQEVYKSKEIPGWLQDSLVNILHLITETGFWAASKPPIDWAPKNGLFGMVESPRGCPQMECLPCTWYGTLPITLFYPDLAASNLEGHRHYQRADGAPMFIWGKGGDMGGHTAFDWQHVLNGFCLTDLAYRLWSRDRSEKTLADLYPLVKKTTQFSMSLRTGEDAVISMPEGNAGREWWEGWDWFGMTAHAGGLRLAQLEMAQDMAARVGDREFADQCRDWLNQGKTSMENKMWNDATKSYLLYNDPKVGKKSDAIMANQFDGEWVAHLDGLPGIFRADRVKQGLETIKKSCLVDMTGSVAFAKADGTPELVGYGIFPPEIMMAGMAYLYDGEKTTGLKVLYDLMYNLTIRHKYAWDQPNMLSCDTGERGAGSDYYQNTILWAAPAAVYGQSISDLCKPDGLVGRMIGR